MMDKLTYYLKKIVANSLIDHLLFVLLGVLSLWLFQERLFADSGYYIFKVVNNESFWVEHSRPLAFLLLLFVLCFHFISANREHWSHYITYLVIVISIVIFKKLFASEYEISKTQGFITALKTLSFDLKYAKGLVNYLLAHYWGLLILFCLTLISLASSKNKLSILLYCFAFFSMLVIVNYSHYGFYHSRYHEQVYFPLIFIGIFNIHLPNSNNYKNTSFLYK